MLPVIPDTYPGSVPASQTDFERSLLLPVSSLCHESSSPYASVSASAPGGVPNPVSEGVVSLPTTPVQISPPSRSVQARRPPQ